MENLEFLVIVISVCGAMAGLNYFERKSITRQLNRISKELKELNEVKVVDIQRINKNLSDTERKSTI